MLAERPDANNNNWMNLLIFKDIKKFDTIKKLIEFLEIKKIEARPVWKLNHQQIKFKKYQTYKIQKAVKLYSSSLCVPSGLNITKKKIDYVIKSIKDYLDG